MGLIIPTAGQCFAVAAPVASIYGIIWFARHGDRVIEKLFPHWEWERKLGWLNVRANRRAEWMLRGLRHLLHAFLLLALIGILGLSWLAGRPHDMDNAPEVFAYALELIYIGVCMAPWLFYFIVVLGPRMIAEYEEEELQRYRAEHPESDGESKSEPPPRITVWDSTSSFRRR